MSEILRLPRLDPPRELREQRGQLLGPDEQRIPVSVTAIAPARRARRRDAGLAVIVRDLREIEALQQRLVLSGRMAAVGQLAAGVAHEVNNPTSYVRTNMLLLARVLAERERRCSRSTGSSAATTPTWSSPTARELIDESLEGIERITAIVDQIRRFSHAKTRRARARRAAPAARDGRAHGAAAPAGERADRARASAPCPPSSARRASSSRCS